MKHKGNGRRAWLGRGEEIEEEKTEGGEGIGTWSSSTGDFQSFLFFFNRTILPKSPY